MIIWKYLDIFCTKLEMEFKNTCQSLDMFDSVHRDQEEQSFQSSVLA